MGTAKEEVRKMLDQIPDNASFEDIHTTSMYVKRLNVG